MTPTPGQMAAERALFEKAFMAHYTNGAHLLERFDTGHYRSEEARAAWRIATEFRAALSQATVAVPEGIVSRIEAAMQRIQDGHGLRRIPADPTDVDLVLAECRAVFTGKWPPFWIKDAATPAQAQPCGHPNSLLVKSAETGEPLYCEACDDKAGRRDAEARESELAAENQELRSRIAELKATQAQRPADVEPSNIPPRYRIDYDNDTGMEDEVFYEWWAVVDEHSGQPVCKCDDEADAKRICDLLNLPATQPAEPSDAAFRDEQEQPFEDWWGREGQFVRSGGGDYEKSFAWAAWLAALAKFGGKQ
jgi:hypothetical protein